MTIENYAAFLLASFIVVIIPGPTVLMVLSQSLTKGRRSVIPLVLGVGLGDLIALTLSFLGLGTILANSAFLFSVLKWIGAAYLIYLGIKAFRTIPMIDSKTDIEPLGQRKKQFQDAFLTTALNPKSIVFFVAFVPQFIVPSSPMVPQFVLLGASFLALGMLNAASYALFAGRLSSRLKNLRTVRNINRCGGLILIAASMLTIVSTTSK